MVDDNKLPERLAAGHIVSKAQRSGSLVTRGLESIRNRYLKPPPVTPVPPPNQLAEEADAEAQFELGEAYYYGDGVPQDYSLAIHWFRKAADQGYPEGNYMLGSAYWEQQDLVNACMWFTIDWYGLGVKNSKFTHRTLHNPSADQHVRELRKLMTPAQVSETKRLVREWKKKHVS